MKFICDRNVLSNAVAGVSKAVTQRSSVPVLEGILCKAEGFALTLTGYDLEMGITTTVEANVLEPGETVLPAKLLGDMVRRLSSDEVEITCLDTGVATVKGGITEFDIMTLNPGDFPAPRRFAREQTRHQRFSHAAFAADDADDLLHPAARVRRGEQTLRLLPRCARAPARGAVMRTFFCHHVHLCIRFMGYYSIRLGMRQAVIMPESESTDTPAAFSGQ